MLPRTAIVHRRPRVTTKRSTLKRNAPATSTGAFALQSKQLVTGRCLPPFVVSALAAAAAVCSFLAVFLRATFLFAAGCTLVSATGGCILHHLRAGFSVFAFAAGSGIFCGAAGSDFLAVLRAGFRVLAGMLVLNRRRIADGRTVRSGFFNERVAENRPTVCDGSHRRVGVLFPENLFQRLA